MSITHKLLIRNMTKGSKFFRTTNLDLACVLVAEGNICTTKKLGPVSAEFVFTEDTDVSWTAKQFYRGEVEINVTSFMYARFALKRELAMKSVEWRHAKEGKLVLTPGQFYYFVGDDGRAYKNIYANRTPHVERLINGNAFLTMNEAQVVAANAKVD